MQFDYDIHGRYPAELSNLTPDLISAEPKDPDGLSDYQYCVSSTKGYHLGTREEGLEMTNENALLADADTGVVGNPDGCVQGSFSGEDPVYNVVP